MSCVHLLLCLQIPCSSVSHKSLTPLGAPLSVGATLYTHLLGSYKRQLDVQKSVVLSLL